MQRPLFALIAGLMVLLCTKPMSALDTVITGGTSTGPGSFPYAFIRANILNPVSFAPAANGLTCNLLDDLPATRISVVDLTGLTSPFTIDGSGTVRFPPFGITYSDPTIAGINFNGPGSLTFKSSGLSNLGSGSLFISFLEGTFLFTGNGGILNRDTGTTVIVVAGGNLTVNEAGGFGNSGSGNMVVVVPSGVLSFSQGSGFGNGGSGTYSTHISGGSLSFSRNTLPPFNNFGTGAMINNISGGSISLFGSTSFANRSTGRVTNNISGGTLTFSGSETWGFVNSSTSTMTNNISGGMLSFSSGATGFVNSGGGMMSTMISGGTVFMDGANAAYGTDLNFSDMGIFSSGINGVTFGGRYEGSDYTANLTFSAKTATHQAAIGPESLPVQMVTPTGVAGTSTATLGGATLDVVSTSSPSSLVGNTYTIMNTATGAGYNPSIITGTYGTLTSSSLIKYTVVYDPLKVTIIPHADQSFGGYAGKSGTNAYRLAQYMDTRSNLAGDQAFIALNNMILAGNLSGYQDALNQIQPSQLQALSGISFNNMTTVTRMGHTQMQAWSLRSLSPQILSQSFLTLEPGRIAQFEELTTKQMNQGDVATLFNNHDQMPQRKGMLAKLSFANSPEQVNPHPLSGRIQIGKANVWFQPYGQLAHQKGNHNGNPGLKSRLGGFALGADYTIAKNTILGFLGGSSSTSFTWNQGRGWGHMNSGFGGLYAAWMEDRGFYVEGQTLFGGNRFKTARRIHFSTIDRTAREAHNAFQFTGNLELGYVIPLCASFTLQPFIMADYMVMRERGYTETGAGTLNMHIKSQTSQFLQGELGAIVYKTFAIDDILLRPTAELGWVQRRPVGSSKNKVKGGLINQPSSLVVTGLNKVYNQIAPGMGLITQFANGLYVSGNVYGQCGNGLNIGEALLRVGYDF